MFAGEADAHSRGCHWVSRGEGGWDSQVQAQDHRLPAGERLLATALLASLSFIPRWDAGPGGPWGVGARPPGVGQAMASKSTGRTGWIWCHADPGAQGPVWPFQRDIRSEPWGPVRRFLSGARDQKQSALDKALCTVLGSGRRPFLGLSAPLGGVEFWGPGATQYRARAGPR